MVFRDIGRIGNMQVYASFYKNRNKVRGWGLVGKERVNLRYAAKSDHGVTVEFAMICDQKDFSGIFDNGLCNTNLMIVVIEQGPVDVNAGDTDNTEIDLKLTDKIDGGLAGNSAIPLSYRSACYNDIEAGIVAQN
jgi:hypothetical protein